MGAKRSNKGLPGKETMEEQLYNSRTADTLPATAKDYRDAFVKSYIIDFNATNACTRLGHANRKSAGVRGSQLLAEPYVRNKVDELLREILPEAVVSRGQVMSALWREANDPRNMCGTRVTALAHIAKMLGMVAKEESSPHIAVNVMVIPCMTVEDWKTSAPIAQGMLKAQAAIHDA